MLFLKTRSRALVSFQNVVDLQVPYIPLPPFLPEESF